jgi:mevalonate kinase
VSGASHIGRGKVILLGEHAVVHGHPALAGAIDRGVRLDARAGDALRLRIPAWDLDVAAGADHPVARALAAVAAALGVTEPVVLEGDADLPPAAGLGSSAAVSVAVTRALAAHAGRTLTLDEVIEIAGASERCFHGNPSGIDVALAARGGLGLYRRASGLAPIACAPVPVVIGLSGQQRATAAMVARVADALARAPEVTAQRLERMGGAAEKGAGLLAAAAPNLAKLGMLLTGAHVVLRDLGLSTPVLDAMVDAALDAGAAGAKLTGGGGGGAVVAIAPGREDAVVEAWRARGKVAFACRVGASGAA